MFKRINNWYLSALVVVVSIISITMIQHYVLAQWQNPISLPGYTSSNSLVINPLVEDLQIDNYRIFGTNIKMYGSGDGPGDGSNIAALEIGGNKEICLNGDCILTWAEGTSGVFGSGDEYFIPKFDDLGELENSVMKEIGQRIDIGYAGIGGALRINSTGGSYKLLEIEAGLNVTEDIFVINNASEDLNQAISFKINDSGAGDTTPLVVDYMGRVGIGTASPNPASEGLLHIKTNSGNAELDIQSGNGDHWGIYQNGQNGPLNFWNGTAGVGKNNVSFTSGGLILSGDGNQVIDIKTDDGEASRTRLMSVSSNGLTETQLQYENMFRLVEGVPGVARFHIAPGGNVGIGTVNPSDELQVLGTGRFESLIVDTSVSANLVTANIGNIADISSSIITTDSIITNSLTADAGLTLNIPLINMKAINDVTGGEDFCTITLKSDRGAGASGSGHWDISCLPPTNICGNFITEPANGEDCDPNGSLNVIYDDTDPEFISCETSYPAENVSSVVQRCGATTSCISDDTCVCRFSCIEYTPPRHRYDVYASCSSDSVAVCAGGDR